MKIRKQNNKIINKIKKMTYKKWVSKLNKAEGNLSSTFFSEPTQIIKY